MLRLPAANAQAGSAAPLQKRLRPSVSRSLLTVRAQQDDGPSAARPGGRGRAEFPSSIPATPTGPDPASIGRPGGRGGRELPSSSEPIQVGQDPATLSRPGGRGRGAEFSTAEGSKPVGWGPPPTDRPGGRGGRNVIPSSEETSGDGGNGGGKDSDGNGGGDGDGGFDSGKAGLSVLLYGGVCAAAYAAHQAFFQKPVAAAPKACCAGKKK